MRKMYVEIEVAIEVGCEVAMEVGCEVSIDVVIAKAAKRGEKTIRNHAGFLEVTLQG